MTLRRWIGLVGWAFVAFAARAQTPAADQEKQPAAAGQRDWAQAQLQQARQEEAALDLATLRQDLRKAGLPESLAADFLAASHETVLNYQTAVDTLATVVNNQRVLDDLRTQPEPASPRTDGDADAMRDRIATLRQQVQASESQVRLDDTLLAKNRAVRDAAASQYRRDADELEAATPEARPRLVLESRLSQLRDQAASSAVFVALWRQHADELESKAAALSLTRLEKAIAASGLDTVFNKTRAEAALARLAQSRDKTGKQLQDAQKTVRALNDTVAALGKDQEQARRTGPAAVADAISSRQAIAGEAAALADRSARTLENTLAALADSESAWRLAIAAAAAPTPANYLAARQHAEAMQAELGPWREQILRATQDSQRRLDELESASAAKDPAARKLDQTRLDLLRQRIAQLRDLSAMLDDLASLEQQMLAESSAQLATQSLPERATQAARAVPSRLLSIWNHEIYVTEDNRGITLGKIVLALFGLLVGLAIAKVISRTVSGNVERRFAVDPSRSAVLEKALFLPLLCIAALTTLNWLHIPLTAFAFLGGALAIGLGFGAQTLINNFISGLILLAERRINIGDTIEVDGHLGKVLNLGTRCSRVLKFDGVEVLVPNSYLLEKNVINWTLSNPHHRYDFGISMSHGQAPADIMALLQRAVDEEDAVMKAPKACVFFEAFSDSGLVFRLYYWLDLRASDNRETGSAIRLRIDRLCREQGIEIALPQRDFNLHTPAPLAVHIKNPPAKS